MWILTKEGDKEKKYSLVQGHDYTLGRGPNNDVCVSDDPSLSRKHARITYDRHDGVIIQDLKSTYGIYVGEDAIRTSANGSQEDRMLASGQKKINQDQTRIRFGLHSTIFRLNKVSFVITTSALSKSDKIGLKSILNEIPDVSFTDDWNDQVTHLVMSHVILTIKVTNALAKGIPIVTPSFWTDFRACYTSNQIIPDPNNYIPPLKETSINSNTVTLKVDTSRSRLFKDKILMFSTDSQAKMFQSAIEYAGGRVVIAKETEEITKDTIRIKSHEDSSQYNGFSIPEAHIGLAVLFNSTEVYCNPSYKLPSILNNERQSQSKKKNQTLVPETQSETLSSILTGTSKIPATLETQQQLLHQGSISNNSQLESLFDSNTSNRISCRYNSETQLSSQSLPSQTKSSRKKKTESRTLIQTNSLDLYFKPSSKSVSKKTFDVEISNTASDKGITIDTDVQKGSNDQRIPFEANESDTSQQSDTNVSSKRRLINDPTPSSSNKRMKMNDDEDDDDLFSFKRRRSSESNKENVSKRFCQEENSDDAHGFIAKSNKSTTVDEMCVQFVDLIRKNPVKPKTLDSTVKNFKKFRSKRIRVPTRRITNFVKEEDLTTQNGSKSIGEFFEDDNEEEKEKESQEAEDFWSFQSQNRVRKR